jgi:hypothetical protein
MSLGAGAGKSVEFKETDNSAAKILASMSTVIASSGSNKRKPAGGDPDWTAEAEETSRDEKTSNKPNKLKRQKTVANQPVTGPSAFTSSALVGSPDQKTVAITFTADWDQKEINPISACMLKVDAKYSASEKSYGQYAFNVFIMYEKVSDENLRRKSNKKITRERKGKLIQEDCVVVYEHNNPDFSEALEPDVHPEIPAEACFTESISFHANTERTLYFYAPPKHPAHLKLFKDKDYTIRIVNAELFALVQAGEINFSLKLFPLNMDGKINRSKKSIQIAPKEISLETYEDKEPQSNVVSSSSSHVSSSHGFMTSSSSSSSNTATAQLLDSKAQPAIGLGATSTSNWHPGFNFNTNPQAASVSTLTAYAAAASATVVTPAAPLATTRLLVVNPAAGPPNTDSQHFDKTTIPIRPHR